jgi:hypothetical protein
MAAGDTGAVTGLLAEVAAAAADLQDFEAAMTVRAEAGAVASHAARAVVVGEKKRGKTSLINALVGRYDLLPVDADIATSVHVSVYAADREQARVVDDDHPAGREITLAEVAEYAALNPGTLQMSHPGVREVSVGLPDQLLASGLTLVDTPGVGGLVSGHAALTLAISSTADALIFVVNGSSELTASECAFLEQATHRVATVVFVLTQKDKYPKWREVLAANQALILKHAPQFADAPWFAASSLDARRAASAGDPAQVEALEQRSGLAPLREMLACRIAGRAGQLRAVNSAWVARRVVDKLITAQEQRLRSLDEDPRPSRSLAAMKEQLAECRKADSVWRRDLDSKFQKLNVQVLQKFRSEIVDLQVTAGLWAAEASMATATQIEHDITAGVEALCAVAETAAREGALRVAADIASQLRTDGIDALDARIPNPEQFTHTPGLVLTPENRADGVSGAVAHYWPVLSGLSMTAMLARLLTGQRHRIAVIGIGSAVAAILYRGNKDKAATQRTRSDLQRHVNNVALQVNAKMPGAIQEMVDGLRVNVKDAIVAQMTARDTQLTAAIAECDRNVKASEQERAPKRAAAEESLRHLRRLAALATELIGATAADGRS